MLISFDVWAEPDIVQSHADVSYKPNEDMFNDIEANEERTFLQQIWSAFWFYNNKP